MGLSFFATTHPKQNEGDSTDCATGDVYRLQPDVAFGPLPQNAPALKAAFARFAPGGGSPVYPALLGTLSLATARKDAVPGHQVVALVVTAGFPDTCLPVEQTDSDAYDVDEVSALAAEALTYNGVLTYVVGPVNGNEPWLASLAKAGGTGVAYNSTSAADVQAFSNAMNALRAPSLPCRLPIPSAADGTAVHITTGSTSYLVPALGDANLCSGLSGWYPAVSPDGALYVQLCPASCSVIQGDASATIDIAANCPSDAGAADAAAGSANDTSACKEDCTKLKPPACNVALCDAKSGQCVVVPSAAGTKCDDGLFCTVDDACDGAGVCRGNPNTCGLGECDQPICDEELRTCTPNPAAEGSSCVPAGLCASGGECHNGQCIATPRSCAFFPVPARACYTTPECNAQRGACEATPANDYAPCPDDGDQCKVGKTCLGGACQGGMPKDCSWVADVCNTAGCNPQIGCVGMPFADGTACAPSSVCAAFGCVSGYCQVSATNQGGACSDGNACTTNDTCGASGVCQGTPSQAGYTSYFDDPLGDNAHGWTLTGSDWQIAPPGPLPACTTGSASGLALWSAVNGDLRACLESPPIDASQASTLWLEFSHELNLTGNDQFNADVFDGTEWTTVWSEQEIGGYNSVLDECTWTRESVDITTLRWSGLRVRFCAALTSGATGTALVNDVVVANQQCRVVGP
jgi:hypothetical protein